MMVCQIQELDGDPPAQVLVFGQVDHTHATLT
jgi:hypothetical protein